MHTVSDVVSVVESDLMSGALSCPACTGRLRPWGWARPRTIRVAGGGEVQRGIRHRPRRARCASCRCTHVLLPVSLAARRADCAVVIAAAIEAKAIEGVGHRVIAARLGRPASTVRGWLRSFASCAGQITVAFASLTLRDAPDAAHVWPAPAPGSAGALSALMAYAQGLGERFGAVVTVAWVQAGIAACNGWLFSQSWWGGDAQHEYALPKGLRLGHAGSCAAAVLVAGVFPAQ